MFVKVSRKLLMDINGSLKILNYNSITLSVILIAMRVGGRASQRPHKPQETRALLVPATNFSVV